ncbi:MAG: alpha/beta hydrolase family protein [Steroidobacteraceae bacterium]
MRNVGSCATTARRGGTRLLAASLLAMTGVLAAPSRGAVPLSVYGQLPGIEDVAISPDGSRLAGGRRRSLTRVTRSCSLTTGAPMSMSICWKPASGKWGRKMQTDLSDGVDYLVKRGIADPAKVCFVGASYGGYAALAGVTLQPTVYRCAVSVAGISDLARMMRWEGRGGADARWIGRYWDRFWGVSGSSDPRLGVISPIEHVDAVRAPVLLIHGRDDTVVPFEQSQIMFDALRADNKDVQLVTLKNEDHWLSNSKTRLQMLQATVAFLRAHDPPD